MPTAQSWKKVIVSGSIAELAQVTASTGLNLPGAAAADAVLTIDASGVVASTAISNISGDITSVNAGNGIDVNSTTGAVTVSAETASTSNQGVVELATTGETTTGTDTTRAVTPDGLKDGYQGSSNVTTLGTITTGTWTGDVIGTDYLSGQSGTNTGDEAAASDTVAGVVELATTGETTTGTATDRAVTPDGLKDGYQGSSNVTTLGTITTGTWTGTSIGTGYTAAKVTSVNAGNGIDVNSTTGAVTVSAETASTSNQGVVELATTGETTTGTDAAKAVTPDGLKDGYQGSANVTTLGTITTGTWTGTAIGTDYLSGQSGTNTGDEPAASDTVAGIIELATDYETNTGTATDRAITPANLDAFTGNNAIVSVGTLNAGSITSGFGAIDNGSSNITTTGTISGSTIQTSALYVTGSAEMSGDLVFNGVTFSESSIASVTGSTTSGTNGAGNTHTFYGDVTVTGSVYVSNDVHIADDLFVTDDATISGDLAVTGTVTSGTWQGTSIGTGYTDAKVTQLAAGNGIDVSSTTGAITVSAETASTSNQGIVELATTGETTTGTDTTRAVTPDGLKDGYQGSSNVTTLGTITTGTWTGDVIGTDYLSGQSGTNTGDEAAASDTVAGIVELATTGETTTGTATDRAVTPDGLKDGYQGSANVTTLGTITTGTWTGTSIGTGYTDAKVTQLAAGNGIDVSSTTGAITVSAETASTSNQGIVELATTGETTTGTSTSRAVTPDGLKDGYQGSANVTTLGTITTGTWTGTSIGTGYTDAKVTQLAAGDGIDISSTTGAITVSAETASTSNKGVVELATNTETNTGTDTARAITPSNLAAWTGASDVSDTNLRTALAALEPGGGTLNIGDPGDDLDVVIRGNLQVDGTTTTVNTETIELADNFIVLNSNIDDASGVMVDSGITIKGGNSADQSMYWDVASGRWSLTKQATADDTSLDAWIATVYTTGSVPVGIPVYGANVGDAVGAMAIHGNDIYIYA